MDKQTSSLLHELEPVAERLLNRHLGAADTWYPHQYVPYSEGQNYRRLDRRGEVVMDGTDWNPTQSKLGQVAQMAWYLNLLTEDNLPGYHREISRMFGRDAAWGQWVDRWTAEENRHSTAMRDFIHVTRGVNPIVLDDTRMIQMQRSYNATDPKTGEPKNPVEAIAYVSLQELATRISHRNTGKLCKAEGNDHAYNLLWQISTDENHHMVFYRDLGEAALEIAPNVMMRAIANEVKRFRMPGAETIPQFNDMAVELSIAGIYSHRIHRDQVLHPILNTHWKVLDNPYVFGDGAAAQDEIGISIEKLGGIVERAEGLQQAYVAAEPDHTNKLYQAVFGQQP